LKIETHKDLKTFFDANYRNAVLQATRIVQNQTIAEDVVQDCLIKLWDSKEKLSMGTVERYFSTMVRNKCIDLLRKRKFNIVDTDEIQIAVEDPSKLEFEELRAKINATIDSLPERCRQVFVLSRFQAMSYKEIAESLDISPKTVENHISKALKTLSAALASILILLFFNSR